MEHEQALAILDKFLDEHPAWRPKGDGYGCFRSGFAAGWENPRTNALLGRKPSSSDVAWATGARLGRRLKETDWKPGKGTF